MTKSHPIPDAALAAHLAILGKTGAGKTYSARSTVERSLSRGERVCIIDPTGVWWGLRLGPEGKKRSRFPAVIAGGRHGDIPLMEHDGAALAKVVGTTSTPMILDVSAMTVSARTTFFTAFAESLLIENIGPLYLVLDEAHLFAPQTRVQDPRSAMMVHATNNLVSLGRARGLRIMLLSQRPAKLHKDSLTQVETLVAMRLVAPQDRKAVEEWISGQGDKKQVAEIIASLPGLAVGEAWIWAPTVGVLERATFPTIATFDSMRPETQGVRELPSVDVAAIRQALSSTAHEATHHPTPNSEKASRKDIEAAERRGYERGLKEGDLRGRDAAWTHTLSRLQNARHAIEEGIGEIENLQRPLGEKLVAPTRPIRQRAAPAPESGAGSLPPARQRMLDTLAWFQALGLDPVERTRVCVMVGLSPKASTFGVYVSELARDGLLETMQPGMLHLTAAGEQRAAAPDLDDDPDAIVRAACAQLKPQPRRLLKIIAAAHPRAIERAYLADELGLSRTASTLGVYLSDLSSRGFIENAGRGEVRAAAFLFREGAAS